MNNYALSLEHVSKSYQDGNEKRLVLDDVNLNVLPGEFVAIVGPSGSGKSTLLSIAGLMLSADEGNVYLNGNNESFISKKKWAKERRDNLGFIFQTHELLPYLKGKEQLNVLKKNERSAELLAELGVSNVADKYPSQMSGGERQRVAIARAFASDPKVILADEPTASLDGVRGRQIVEMIQKEVHHYQKAAIMVTHDERVLDLVDHIYRLEDGKLKFEK